MEASKPLNELIIELRRQATSGNNDERQVARKALAAMIANASDDERASIVDELKVPPRGDFTI